MGSTGRAALAAGFAGADVLETTGFDLADATGLTALAGLATGFAAGFVTFLVTAFF
jgi:hypothetical protein